LAGNEFDKSPQILRELFMPFFEQCFNITIHAGETGSVNNIWEAVYNLNANRIGHGLKILDREEIIPQLIYKNISVEMCPSSNRQIVGYGKQGDTLYPLKEYMNRGLIVTVNTDNQGLSRTSMSNEFYEAAILCNGLSLWDCIVLISNSIRVAFVDEITKSKLSCNFENAIYEWCNKNIP
jgi:adenosine deaminase